VFKRHTVPDSAGFLPVNLPSGQPVSAASASPASGSTRFKFPRARSLEAGEEKKSSTEELIEPRSNGGESRRRRSPDGVGHHNGLGGGVHQHQHHTQPINSAGLAIDTVGFIFYIENNAKDDHNYT
jgi:hypothetical protein